jgi:hypothetical protein
MRRLGTESSCPYPGRSASQAIWAARGVGLRPTSKAVERPPNPTAAAVPRGAGLRATAKAGERPPDPPVTQTARLAVTLGVIGQKSADGLVAQRKGWDTVKARTSGNERDGRASTAVRHLTG